MLDKESLWKSILESVKVLVSSAIFNTWFAQTYLIEIEKKDGFLNIIVGCPSTFVKTTIENRYFGLIYDALKKEIKEKFNLIFVVQQPQKEKEKESPPLFILRDSKDKEEFQKSLEKSKIRPFFTFNNFAVSSSNQMAWAAAEAVAKSPGNAYNPLFIWGGVGVGKTHLTNAIGYKILKDNPDTPVLFVTGEEFTNDIVEGIRNRTTQKVRSKYRKLKALLIDDIQFIAGKDAIQEEFFHTFNSLIAAGSQIVLTSDKPPQEISKLEERLRSRFEAGLIVDIAPPDFELRCAILQIKAKEKKVSLEPDLIELIAGNITSTRAMEGFLIRLISESIFKKRKIDKEMIISLLGKENQELKGIKATPEEVIKAATKYFSLSKKKLLGPSRARPIALPRQILMYFLRTELKLPLEEVGRILGGRDHTTVMHAVEKISQLASKNVEIRRDIMGIKKAL